MAELIWQGKYRDGKRVAPARVALPLQTVETVNRSPTPADWRNRLIWGDKKYVLPSLLPEFAGRVDLIYIDPPFNTDSDFSFRTEIPESGGSTERPSRPSRPSRIEKRAYRDTWGKGLDSYLQWFSDTVSVLRELLSERGTLYAHLDSHASHYAKQILDESFGGDRFLNEIIWRRAFAHNDPSRCGMIHDTLLVYTRSGEYTWNRVLQKPSREYLEQFFDQYDEERKERYNRVPLDAPRHGDGGNLVYEWRGVWPARNRTWAVVRDKMLEYDRAGRIHYPRNEGGMPRLKRYESEYQGTPIQDIWTDINKIHNQSPELLNYSTQKPEALLGRVITASSNEGDLVLDCFCGSGTTATVAEKLGRRWIACDLGRSALHTTRKRLLAIPGVRPFVVQDLGPHERLAWLAAEFDGASDRTVSGSRYRAFILRLLGADPWPGSLVHGIRAGRMIHVGAAGAAVTIDDVRAMVKEVDRAAQRAGGASRAAADVLGWEFAFEPGETARQIATESRVEVRFRRIPREVLDPRAAGDVQARDFFVVSELSARLTSKKLAVTLELTDFTVPADDLPDDVRRAVNHWSQWIDCWAVDWNHQGHTFHNEWHAHRTRSAPALEVMASHEYQAAGTYTVMVQVIDILGHDTTRVLAVKVE